MTYTLGKTFSFGGSECFLAKNRNRFAQDEKIQSVPFSVLLCYILITRKCSYTN